jgi:hypothetical protein
MGEIAIRVVGPVRAMILIVTCSKAKCTPVPESLCVRSLTGDGGVERRSATWIDRLRCADAPTLPASELYRGDHWQQVRQLAHQVRGAGGSIHICSAGYGLVPFAAPLKPYSATFSAGQADSIAPPGAGATAAAMSWWRALSQWVGPSPGEPRSVSELVTRAPDDFLLVVASESYLRAITPDLIAALGRHPRPEHFAILCAGAGGKAHPLADYLLPCDARLQPIVGGARAALNARLARRALQELAGGDWTPGRLREYFTRRLAARGACPGLPRERMEDAEVRRFLREALANEPSARPTPLLHRLRARGNACQRERFARLFREAQEAADAHPL